MNLLLEHKREGLNKTDMMGQLLETGDVVWRFYVSGSALRRVLAVVVKDTKVKVSVLEARAWQSTPSSVYYDKLLKHDFPEAVSPRDISDLKGSFEEYLDTLKEAKKP